MITEKEILTFVEKSGFNAYEIKTGDFWREYANGYGFFQVNISLDDVSNKWNVDTYQDKYDEELECYQTDFDRNLSQGLTLNKSIATGAEKTKIVEHNYKDIPILPISVPLSAVPSEPTWQQAHQ